MFAFRFTSVTEHGWSGGNVRLVPKQAVEDQYLISVLQAGQYWKVTLV